MSKAQNWAKCLSSVPNAVEQRILSCIVPNCSVCFCSCEAVVCSVDLLITHTHTHCHPQNCISYVIDAADVSNLSMKVCTHNAF